MAHHTVASRMCKLNSIRRVIERKIKKHFSARQNFWFYHSTGTVCTRGLVSSERIIITK